MYETYYTHSTYSLLGMAREFRTLVAALNGSPNVDYERISMSAPQKHVLVSADKDGVRYNFSSAAVAGMIMGEVGDMQTVADTVRTRLKGMPEAQQHEPVLADMERECRDCLDRRFSAAHPLIGWLMGPREL